MKNVYAPMICMLRAMILTKFQDAKTLQLRHEHFQMTLLR